MEIFTEIEFQGQELQFIDLTKKILQDEGWEIINEKVFNEHHPITKGLPPTEKTVAIKCWFKRII